MSLYDNLKKQISDYKQELEYYDTEKRNDMIGIAKYVDTNGYIYSHADKKWVKYNENDFMYVSNEQLLDMYYEHKKHYKK